MNSGHHLPHLKSTPFCRCRSVNRAHRGVFPTLPGRIMAWPRPESRSWGCWCWGTFHKEVFLSVLLNVLRGFPGESVIFWLFLWRRFLNLLAAAFWMKPPCETVMSSECQLVCLSEATVCLYRSACGDRPVIQPRVKFRTSVPTSSVQSTLCLTHRPADCQDSENIFMVWHL